MMKRGVDYIGVGVGAIFINSEGKLFLAKRGRRAKNEKGLWEIPGGGVEFGETFAQAIKREMMEELGVEIVVMEQIGLYDHILPEEKQHWVASSFICNIVSGEPEIKEKDKLSEIGWFSLQEAEQLPLAMLGKLDILNLKKKFPKGIPMIHKPVGE